MELGIFFFLIPPLHTLLTVSFDMCLHADSITAIAITNWLGYLDVHIISTSVISTLRDPMDCSTPGFPVLHHLLELAQTHLHQVSDVIQPCHPLSSPSPAFNLSQHQGLF